MDPFRQIHLAECKSRTKVLLQISDTVQQSGLLIKEDGDLIYHLTYVLACELPPLIPERRGILGVVKQKIFQTIDKIYSAIKSKDYIRTFIHNVTGQNYKNHLDEVKKLLELLKNHYKLQLETINWVEIRDNLLGNTGFANSHFMEFIFAMDRNFAASLCMKNRVICRALIESIKETFIFFGIEDDDSIEQLAYALGTINFEIFENLSDIKRSLMAIFHIYQLLMSNFLTTLIIILGRNIQNNTSFNVIICDIVPTLIRNVESVHLDVLNLFEKYKEVGFNDDKLNTSKCLPQIQLTNGGMVDKYLKEYKYNLKTAYDICTILSTCPKPENISSYGPWQDIIMVLTALEENSLQNLDSLLKFFQKLFKLKKTNEPTEEVPESTEEVHYQSVGDDDSAEVDNSIDEIFIFQDDEFEGRPDDDSADKCTDPISPDYSTTQVKHLMEELCAKLELVKADRERCTKKKEDLNEVVADDVDGEDADSKLTPSVSVEDIEDKNTSTEMPNLRAEAIFDLEKRNSEIKGAKDFNNVLSELGKNFTSFEKTEETFGSDNDIDED